MRTVGGGFREDWSLSARSNRIAYLRTRADRWQLLTPEETTAEQDGKGQQDQDA